MTATYTFTFGGVRSTVVIQDPLPDLAGAGRFLIVCDANTEPLARRLGGAAGPPRCVLPPGEAHKDWPAVEKILREARRAGLGRDGVFVAVGGGVVSDLTGFAASIYMRGAGLWIVSTTLLGMVDAALGGKTGFDLEGVKNLAGTFYPAERVFMPLSSLESLPAAEWKSGMAELIKTAALAGGDFLDTARGLRAERAGGPTLMTCVARAAAFKGRIVEEDPRETGGRRALLNLGHTFGHALEAAAGLGTITHGEAVAWGMARACDLGTALGITPPERAARIRGVLDEFGYETGVPYPGAPVEAMIAAMAADKKARGGAPVFVVPDAESARVVSGFPGGMDLVRRILGERS